MKLVHITFLMFIFLKQFYIFKSGGIQPADLIFIFCFIIYALEKIRTRKFKIEKLDKYIVAFIYFTNLINIFYFFIYRKKDFLMASLYYVYSGMLVIVFRELVKSDKFKNNLLKLLKFNLLIQLVINIIGIGKTFGGGTRYMGTFNDPNQMAFYIYSLFLLIVIISNIQSIKLSLGYYLITIFLIIETGSTGMLLGMIIFSFIYISIKLIKINKDISIKKKNIYMYSFFIVVILLIIMSSKNVISVSLKDMNILDRIEQKVSQISSQEDSTTSIIEERGIDKLIIYPERIIFGAGEGYYSRFDKAYHLLEIHSTLPSILFYYGIIPTTILVFWLYRNIKYTPITMSSVYISLIVESFTLLNQRQPFFWMLFVLARLYLEEEKV